MKISSQFRHVYLDFNMLNVLGLGLGVWGFDVDSSIVDERVLVRFIIIKRNKYLQVKGHGCFTYMTRAHEKTWFVIYHGHGQQFEDQEKSTSHFEGLG